jgi:hypothetical protein
MLKWLLGANPYNIKATDIGVPKSTGNVGQIIVNVAGLLIGLVGSLAVLFLIVGGIQMVISTGDAKKVQQARDTLTYAVVGIVVAIAALAIISFVANAVK